jgi:predicted ABC-type ATPase
MVKKQLWVLAGGNGSGKSTYYKYYLKDKNLEFINADEIALKISSVITKEVSWKAQDEARKLYETYLYEGKTFCFETVFSHESKLDLLKKAKELSYEIVLVYIHLLDPILNVARVNQRVVGGGHSVPEDKILSRIPRTVELVKQATVFADEIILYDNSDSSNPFMQIAVLDKNKNVGIKVEKLPDWAEGILQPFVKYKFF